MHAGQLFTWRRMAREGLLDDPDREATAVGFAPVVVSAEPSPIRAFALRSLHLPMVPVTPPSPITFRN